MMWSYLRGGPQHQQHGGQAMQGPRDTRLQPRLAAHCRVTSPCLWLMPLSLLEVSSLSTTPTEIWPSPRFTSSMGSFLITPQKGSLLPPPHLLVCSCSAELCTQ